MDKSLGRGELDANSGSKKIVLGVFGSATLALYPLLAFRTTALQRVKS